MESLAAVVLHEGASPPGSAGAPRACVLWGLVAAAPDVESDTRASKRAPRQRGSATGAQHLATRWLRQAEKLAGLEPLQGGAWHPFRRAWATSRKDLSLKDVAEAGGWKDTTTLLKCYTQPDAETVTAVVLHDRPARVVRN